MALVKAAVLSSLLLAQTSSAQSLPSIIMKGSKLFYENGTQFFIKGVAYQQDSAAGGSTTGSTKYIDPLANPDNCKRDIPLLQKLYTNTIRTYAIDPTADHSQCMQMLQDAGIYVISDLSEPALSINRDTPQWNTDLYKRYTSVVDDLSQYSNVIGFFAGNEVTNNASNTEASAYVKAAVRDTKAYIAKNVKRWMGVGYAANDDAAIRESIAYYFNCGNQNHSIDWWGYNIYEWCGDSTFASSGYQAQVDFFRNYSVPVFFAEYGCNTPGGAAGRIFKETDALYSDEMTPVINGGIVYMYFEEANDYGLVKVDGNTATPLKDYSALQSRLANATPSLIDMKDYTPVNQPQKCPPLGPSWKANGDNLPPTPNEDLCTCMFESLGCVPATGLPTTDYGEMFSYICSQNPAACIGIHGNTTTAVYGAYSMCNSTHQLGYVLDQYYQSQQKADTACDFKGKATTQKPAPDHGDCKAQLASAASQNAAAATATGSVTGTGDGSSSSSSSSAAMPLVITDMFTMREAAVGLYVVFAMLAGGAVILL